MTTYALIDAGTIVKVGSLPTGARRLSDGAWVTPYLRQWTDEQAADCGYLAVVDTAQPADTPTTIHDRSIQLVAGIPTVVWTERPRTADELAQVTATVVTADLQTKVRNAIAGNQAALANVAAATANVQGVIDGTAANLAQANTMLDTLAQTVKAMLTQQERMMRQITAIERLLIGSDLLVENTDT